MNWPPAQGTGKEPESFDYHRRQYFLLKVLLIRGTAQLKTVEGVVPEYVAAAERYFGRDQGQAWVAQMGKMVSSMVRVTITPEWVGLLDFQTRFPSALPL